MKRERLLKSLLMTTAMFAFAMNSDAQNLKSILSSVVQSVVGDKTTTSTSIIGTWVYAGADCQFESESLLSQAGGTVVASEIEEKMETYYEKLGLDGAQYTFEEDETYSSKLKSITTSGTYTFDSDEKTITMKTKLGIKTVAYVTVTGSTMTLVFDADKLLSVLKTVTSLTSSASSIASGISSLADSYDGLRLGFELTKQ